MTDKQRAFEEQVFPAEIQEVKARRLRLGLTALPEGVARPSTDLGLLGLACSGGGVRSATFSLGVIQALARQDLLKHVDYLSTVSGGGFTGSCVSSLLTDPGAGPDRGRFPLLDTDCAVDPPAVSHLRNSSKYLAPGGLIDKLRIPAIAVRGVLGNFFVFLLIVLLAVLATKAVYAVVPASGASLQNLASLALLVFVLMVLVFPLAARIYHAHSSWSVRNLGEVLFTVALIALAAALLLVPLQLLVNQAVDESWGDLRESVAFDLQRPFQPDDYLSWLGLLAALVLFMFMARVSGHLQRLSNRLVLLVIGLAAPAILLLLYLALVLIQVDSPQLSASRLFSLPAQYAHELDREALTPAVRRQFEEQHIALPAIAAIETLEPRQRWVVKGSDRSYSIVRDGSGLGVYPDFLGMLGQGRVATELKLALQRKGMLVSKHPTVEPVLVQGAIGGEYRIAGMHRFRLIHRQTGWGLAQVSEPEIVAAAILAAYPGVHLSSRPPHTLIHPGTVLSDTDREAALRFVSTGTPQDFAVVVDRVVPAGWRGDEFAGMFRRQLVEAFSQPIEAAQMAVLAFDRSVDMLKRLEVQTADDYFHIDGGPAGVLDPGLVQKLDFDATASDAPAALLRAVRELVDHGRPAARKSIVYVGTGGPGADNPDWLRSSFPELLRETGIRLFAIPLAGASDLEMFRNLAESTHGVYCPVLGYDVDTLRVALHAALGQVLQSIRAESPAAGPLRLQDRRQQANYTLSRVGPYVRVDAGLPGVQLEADELNGSTTEGAVAAPVRELFASQGIELASGATVVSLGRCDDRAAGDEGSDCWELRDPYSYLVSTKDGAMTVRREGQTAPGPWTGLLPTKEIDYLLLLLLLLLAVYALVLDVNLTSVHRFYRDRLSRAYLIRSGGNGEVTHNDRQRLSALNGEGTAAPYHLVNAALNLQGSADPGLRGRKADFFIFSKHFVGSPRTGFAPTRTMEALDPDLDLGAAMAISGAAAAPNMGATTVKPLVFLLTLLNIRLGYWVPNPVRVHHAGLLQRLRWRLGPGSMFLLKEALGWLDTRSAYVNVSDGGHIENLAVYELLRRRCALIIAIDGEADPKMSFGGLVKLMLYARIDLGIEMDIDLDPIRKNADGVSREHWAVARIRYPNNQTGTLVYIKSSVSGDEQEYVREYRQRHAAFPHEPTADQFFEERQFEAYRALGYHIGGQVFADAAIAAQIAR